MLFFDVIKNVKEIVLEGVDVNIFGVKVLDDKMLEIILEWFIFYLKLLFLFFVLFL